METALPLLRALGVFGEVDAVELARAEWRTIALRPGERLWTEGSAVEELGILAEGELDAAVDGVAVGTLRAGEILGETTAFFAGGTRSTTLTARSECRVCTLPVPSLRTLRWRRSPLYSALLTRALAAMAFRLRATNLRIAARAEGEEPRPHRGSRPWLARWREARTEVPACPDLAPLLRRLPGLWGVEAAVLATLADAFVPEAAPVGHILCVEGEPGACAWLVGAGRFDVLEQVDDERAARLATLGEGERLGLLSLVDGGPRSASCVAVEPGWVFRMERDRYVALAGEPRLYWDECLVAALGQQLRGANQAWAKLGGAQ